jgi:serine phosphatase RsbU (regulator of sigma subunit)/uncharacterized protein HemY
MRFVFKVFLIISLQAFSFDAFSQKKSDGDSLLNILAKNIQEDTTRVRILSQLCWRNRNNDFVIAIGFGKQALELAQKIKDYKGQAEVLNYMGVVYRNMGDYIEATNRFFAALKIAEQHQVTLQVAYSNNNIGDILKAQKKFEEALPYSKSALKLFETLKDERGMGYAYVRLGEIYQSLKQFDQAIINFEKSLEIRLKLNDLSTLITSFNRVGTIHSLKKEYPQALVYYQKGLDLAKKLNDKRSIAGCLDNIAWLHIRLNDYKAAENFARQSLALAQEIKAKVDEKNAYLTLSKLYESQSQFIISYDFYKKYVSLNDSIDNIEKANQLSKMQVVYDNKKKEQENLLLRKENELNARDAALKNWILLAVSIAFLLALGLIYYVYRSRQKQVKLNAILENQKEEIAAQREALEQTNKEIIRKNDKLGKNIEILSQLSKSEAVANGEWLALSKAINIAVVKALEVSVCQLWYFNYKENAFYCIDTYTQTGFNPTSGKLTVAEVPIFLEVLQSENPLLINNIQKLKYSDEKSKAFLNQQGIQSMIIAPTVLSQKQKILLVCMHLEPRTWELEDLIFLQSMADEMAIAYQGYRRKQAQSRIQKQNEEITSSINYARRIQTAFLPLNEDIATYIPQFFILYKPRDIVSGDFYWFEQKDNKLILAAADCTGHGVPGALMSMVGNEILNEVVIQRGITEADKILNELHKGVLTALRQDITKNADGMDISLVVIDYQNKIMEFAGARNPLYYIQDQVFKQVKANIFSIGGTLMGIERQFTKHIIDISIPTTFYLFSDGFQDQFGGEQNKKFMAKHLKNLLFSIHQKEMNEQKEILDSQINEWMQIGKTQQTDDILLIGVKIAI